jgi:G3E family GTPase
MSFIPTTILTGFLGSGKTTLLNRVLNEAHGLRIAVIENEFGEENIDAEILVTDVRENIIQMSNGCVCCTIREDLRASLLELAEGRRKSTLNFDRVVIETTGMANPGPVAQTFFMDERIAEAYTLDSILTLVDAHHAAGQLDRHQEARFQVGFADRIFISKTDLADPRAVDYLRKRLVRMNARAPHRLVHFGDVELSEVFGLRGFNLTATLDIDPAFLAEPPVHDHDPAELHGHHGTHPHDAKGGAAVVIDDVSSFVFRAERAFDPGKLERFFGKLVDAHGTCLLRYKGIIHLRDSARKVIVQGVHQLMSSDQGPRWGPGELRHSRLVFIGTGMPEDFIRSGLGDCLV